MVILVLWPEQFEHIFVSHNPEGYIWNNIMVTISLVAFDLEEMFEIAKLL